MEFHQIDRDQDGLARLLATSITPREKLDEIAAELEPSKSPGQSNAGMRLEMIVGGYNGYLLSFDGAAKLKSSAGSASFVLWKLPEWEVMCAKGIPLENVTVNEAEYHGMLTGTADAAFREVTDLIIAGDSRIAIQQAQKIIGCSQPHLMLLLRKFDALRASFEKVRLVHVKREFNAAADYLTGIVLRKK